MLVLASEVVVWNENSNEFNWVTRFNFNAFSIFVLEILLVISDAFSYD